MAYDYQKALSSGATEDQVLDYLNKTRGYNIQGALQSGASKTQVIEYLAKTEKPKFAIEEPKKDFLSKAADITKNLPGAKLGEAVGTSISGITGLLTGDKQRFEEAVQANEEQMGQVIGDVARSVALPATLAVNPTTALGAASQFGALGAISAGGESAVAGEDIKQVATDAFQGGLISAATGGVLKGITNKITQKFANTPEKVYNNALKVLQKIKSADRSPSKFLAEEGVWGGLGSFKKAAQEGIKLENTKIAEKVSKLSGGATYGEIKKTAIETLKKGLGNLYDDKQLTQFVDDVPVAKLKQGGIVNWKTLNDVRASLGSLIGDNKFLLANPSEKVKAYRAMYGALTGLLQKTSGTQQEFSRLANWRNTNKVVDRAIDVADSKFGLGLFDIVSGTGGVLAGALSGDSVTDRIKNAAIGGTVALGAERLATSPAIKTGLVQLIQKLPIDSTGKVSMAAIIELISKLSTGNNSNE